MKTLLAIIVAVGCTGCAGLFGESMFSGDKGRILISSDAEGMNAFGTMIHGSKEPESPYWPLQMEREVTKRRKFMVTKGGQES